MTTTEAWASSACPLRHVPSRPCSTRAVRAGPQASRVLPVKGPRTTEMPGRSADQRRAALAQANAVRTQRAAAQGRSEARRGLHSIAALADPPPYLATAKLASMLRALPGYGPAKVTAPPRTLPGEPQEELRRPHAAPARRAHRGARGRSLHEATESPTVTATPRSTPTELRGAMEPLLVSLRRAKETKNTVRYE